MNKGKSRMQNITILYLKDTHVNWSPASEQTRKIRDRINLKIKELGNKYFQVKALFDQMNLRRDHLFLKGKELVELFKDQKPGLHLQTQSRRMKEALHCWFAEHFYQEIFDQDPIFLEFLKKEVIIDQISKPAKTKKACKSNKIEEKKVVNKRKNQKVNSISNPYQDVELITNNQPNNDVSAVNSIDNIQKIHPIQIFPQVQVVQPNLPITDYPKEEQIPKNEINETNQNCNQHPNSFSTLPNIGTEEENDSDSDIDEIFQDVIEGMNVLSNGDNFNFDYSDIFYFQP